MLPFALLLVFMLLWAWQLWRANIKDSILPHWQTPLDAKQRPGVAGFFSTFACQVLGVANSLMLVLLFWLQDQQFR
jgi:hypothetical protein